MRYWFTIAGLLCSGSVSAAPCADDSGAHAALQGYLTAMQDHRFSDAFEFVTATMTDSKSREDWAAQQKEGGSQTSYFGTIAKNLTITSTDLR